MTVDAWSSARAAVPALPPFLHTQKASLQAALLAWHATNGRHDLPWISTDPYAIWVSEVMLQQTQVSTGRVRFPDWMERFPTVLALARSPIDDVLKAWEGLGYYARARRLHAGAQAVVARHQGVVPRSREARLALPGIGPSTASAIAAFAWGDRESIFDGNVERVWSRWWGDRAPEFPSAAARHRFYWATADAVTPTEPSQVRAWTQAIMDLGATVCTPKTPRCGDCPFATTCRAYALGTPTAWPVRASKNVTVPVEAWAFEWRLDPHGRLLTQQQPMEGRWGGLWVPLRADTAAEAPLVSGRHRLSHRWIHWSVAEAPPAAPPGAVPMTRAQWEAAAVPHMLRRWWNGLPPHEQDRLLPPT